MTELYAIFIFLFVLFLLLGSSVWVGLALMGVAWVGMELFTSRPAGDPVIVMAEGGVLAKGTIDEIKSNEQVIEAYLGTGLKNKAAS